MNCELCDGPNGKKRRLQFLPWYYKCVHICDSCNVDIKDYIVEVRRLLLDGVDEPTR